MSPNRPRPDNPARTVRIDDRLWKLVRETAQARSTTVSEVVRRAVEQYVTRGKS
jgi:predicted transcriptional regulator